MSEFLKVTAVAVLMSGLASQASAVTVPSFTGTYDEATGIEAAGDYDNIGPPTDVGDFHLVAGVNTFMGSVFSPDDSSDVFNIFVGANQTLVGATLTFAENVSPFNPFLSFGQPQVSWSLSESSVTPQIFEYLVPDCPNGCFSSFSSTQTFTRGEGFYNMLIGNGTFAMNNGDPVDYTMTFTVEETVSQIPVPAGLPLLLGGFGLLVGLKRRR